MFNGSELGKHREAACEALQTMYNMTDLKQWVFDKKQFKKFDRCLDLFLLHYGFLAKQSYSAGQTKYSVVQKFHMLAHFGRQSKWMTPRTCWAYGPESFMSVCKGIASSCDRGTPPWMVAQKVCAKFSLAFDLLKGWLDLGLEE